MSVVPAPMQPANTPQLLDRAVRVFRANFKTFFGIVAIAQIPVILLNSVLGAESVWQQTALFVALTSGIDPLTTGVAPSAAASLAIPVSLLTALFTHLGNASLCWAIITHLLGDKITIGDAYRQVRRRWQSVVGVWFLGGLATVGLIVWWLVACVVGWFTGFGMLVFFNYVIIPLALVTVMAERRTAFEALPRAWQLARHRFWAVFFLVVLLSLLSYALIAGPQALLSGAFGWVLFEGLNDMSGASIGVGSIITNVLSLLLSVVVTPVLWVGYCSIYLDLRVRFEGVDLALALDSAEAPAPPDPPPSGRQLQVDRLATVPAAPIPSAMPKGTEWWWFFLLTIAPVVLIVAFYAVLFAIVFLLFSAVGF